MERAIRGATKPKNAAPKKKYLDVLIPATTSDISLQEMFDALHHRLKEHSWTVVFKSLIVIHILMRQGTKNNVLKYLASERNIMNVPRFKDKSGSHHADQAKNIHAYVAYLDEKITSYHELRLDLAKAHSQSGVAGRLRKLTVAKGLLREVKILQRQMGVLLDCKFFLDEIDNEVTLTAFKLLVQDLLALFQAVNEGVINVLEQYFEMSLVDARDALAIYKNFVKQTEGVVDFLSIARRLQAELKIPIPNLKHAPVSMTVTLEEYVNDPDFEKIRDEYKRSKLGNTNEDKQPTQPASTSEAPKAIQIKLASEEAVIKNNVVTIPNAQPSEKNIFDFFASIEQEQTLIFGNQYNTESFGRTTTNPFIAMQQQQQMNQQALLQQQMSQLTLQQPSTTVPDTNPFRTSVFASPVTSPVASSNFNPFQLQTQALLTPTNPFTVMNHPSPSLQPIKIEDNNPFRRLSSASNFDSIQSFSLPPFQQQQSFNTTFGGNTPSTTSSFAHIQSASNAGF